MLEIAARGKGSQRTYGKCCATRDEDVAHQFRVLAQYEVVHRRYLLGCRGGRIDRGKLRCLGAAASYALELIFELLRRALQLLWRHAFVVLRRHLLHELRVSLLMECGDDRSSLIRRNLIVRTCIMVLSKLL